MMATQIIFSIYLLIFPAQGNEDWKAHAVVDRFISVSGGEQAWSALESSYTRMTWQTRGRLTDFYDTTGNTTWSSVVLITKEPYYLLTRIKKLTGPEELIGYTTQSEWKSENGVLLYENPTANLNLNSVLNDQVATAFYLYNQRKNLQLSYHGSRILYDKKVDEVHVTDSDGLTFHYYFEHATGLLLCWENSQRRNQTFFTDYRSVETNLGTILYSFKREDLADGAWKVRTTIQEVHFNLPLPDVFFDSAIVQTPERVDEVIEATKADQ